MKLKDQPAIIEELVKAAKSPKEFIYDVIAIQHQTTEEVAQKAGMSICHFYVLMNCITKGSGITPQVCVRLSEALDIDPYILGRIIADYKINSYLNGINKNNQGESAEFKEQEAG